MFGLPMNYVVAAACAVLGFSLVFSDQAWAWLKTLKMPTIGGGGSSDPDVAELQALKVIQARFKRTKCPEGQAAVVVCFEHFFHEGV